MSGILYLIPTPLGKVPATHSIPQNSIDIVLGLNTFAVEQVKTSIQFLHSIKHPTPEYLLKFFEVSKKNNSTDSEIEIINLLLEGQNIGLMSEAGCPGVADPGSSLIRLAHHSGVQVVPLVGPASMILALMASGFNGQKFRFNGYLGRDHQARNAELKQLEQDSLQYEQTELFMESPQRNITLLKDAIAGLQNDTWLMVACQLTMPDELIISKTVAEWKRTKLPEIEKKPAIFGIYGESTYRTEIRSRKEAAINVKRW